MAQTMTESPQHDETTENQSALKPTTQASTSNGQPNGRMKHVLRQAAIEALKPAAVAATTAAASYAAKKGPELVKHKVAPKLEGVGGAQGLMDKAGVGKGDLVKAGAKTLASSVKPGGSDGGGPAPSGTGRGRRLPVQDYVDVAAPIDKVYNQWTQFEEFPKFMHRVERVEQRDDTHVMWHENIWGVRRQWEAEITEQHPEERIAWRSTGGPKQVGVVTFSRLADNLTRVQVSLDFQPQGLFEKTASGTRITRRALKSDLMRFKAFMEMGYEETGAWRGEISDGEVHTDVDPADDDQARDDVRDEHDEGDDDAYDERDEQDDEDSHQARPRSRGSRSGRAPAKARG